MENSFQRVKDYLLELNFNIIDENDTDGVIVVDKEEEGIKNLVLGIADPILILEQFIMELKHPSEAIFRSLLVKNREIISGSFVLDSEGHRVMFRDTLQLENLDLNELEGSLNSLSMLLSEYSDEIIHFSKS